MTVVALLKQLFLALILHRLFYDFGQSATAADQTGEQESGALSSSRLPADADPAPVALDRQRRAPGWGKRSPAGGDNFQSEGMLNDLDNDDDDDDDDADSLQAKRAPGWGKRAPGWGKRAPGWGKRAPGWGKRAPGWGKRAPGWGKRAPGWGKRAPGWGKRSMLADVTEQKRAPGWGKRAPGWGKRAPGWGKRAPGWGKRAPGWGKRAPGWGKRAVEVEGDKCSLWSEELDFFISNAIQTESRLRALCGNNPATLHPLSRK